MIPSEVYELACAIDRSGDPSERAIQQAWSIHNALQERGYRVTPIVQ